jgi:hypothetical protein
MKAVSCLRQLFAALSVAACLTALGAGPVRADKLVLKDGKVEFGTITDERDSLIRYFDRYDRPRKLKASEVDTIHYDSRSVRGRVKVAFRKGQPKDRSGYFRLRHSEELELDAEYRTDSLSELDLFFRNGVHLRVLPGTHFRILKAPRSEEAPIDFELYSGRVLASGDRPESLVRLSMPGGVGVGRGAFQAAIRAGAADSSVLVSCIKGLCGVQETRENPGELVVEPGQVTGLGKQQGMYEPREPDPAEVEELGRLAAKVGHYRFSEIEYPKIGYLPKAITGLGFMVFFYGSAIGILNYVNNI